MTSGCLHRLRWKRRHARCCRRMNRRRDGGDDGHYLCQSLPQTLYFEVLPPDLLHVALLLPTLLAQRLEEPHPHTRFLVEGDSELRPLLLCHLEGRATVPQLVLQPIHLPPFLRQLFPGTLQLLFPRRNPLA